uniref:Cupin type-1 domain-containing protein n=1 Tax=Timspurckia oligopyrenoides TaxID=708627 RepID=A0A7S0ZAH6_9RHOD|mmetsp:Transcript_10197/g.18365  ORF Transcript_10197/g.18365 Transcript_10197/m.18365 type:complete len:222 (+) Transcript_10197:1817-2482(+)
MSVEKMAMNLSIQVLLVALVVLVSHVLAQDGRIELPEDAFAFDIFNADVGSTGEGGTIQALDSRNTPGLEGMGISQSLFRVQPGAINSPHLHPRATELLFVIQGVIRVCFVEENGGNLFCNTLGAGMSTVFPLGHIHFQQNIGTTEAVYNSVLNSDNPGVTSIANRLFQFNNDVLSSAFGISATDIATLRDIIPANPAVQGPQPLETTFDPTEFNETLPFL